jgi:pantetheine-phosphate adenylyltransferase
LRTALCPGSFDPFHNGHLDVVERAAGLFDQVVVAAIGNPQKHTGLFSLQERAELIEASTAELGNVRVIFRSGLTVEVAAEVGAVAIVKGLRTVSDFEVETQMAQTNWSLTGIETVLLPAGAGVSFLAARFLREIAGAGGDISHLVPPPVRARLEEKLKP